MIDWETFQKAYQNAPAEVKEVIDSSAVADAVNKVFESEDQKTKQTLIQGLAGHLLSILTIDELLAKLQQKNVAVDQATMQKLLSSLVKSGHTNDNSTEILKRSDSQTSVDSVRTMADDMANAEQTEEEPVHRTSQDDLLKKQ